MSFNLDILTNDVDAVRQVNERVKIVTQNTNAFKVLFLGNSITRHSVKTEIGWNRDCGMAASSEQNDYVHLVLKYLNSVHGEVNYCIANAGCFEQGYENKEISDEFIPAKEFGAQLIIFRLGENVNVKTLDEKLFKRKLDEFINYFKCERSKIVVTDLFWDYPPTANIIKNVCEENGYTFVSIADLGYRDENKAIGEFENRSVSLHPNDLGMRRIADRIIEKL